MRSYVLAAMALALAGCASSGPKIDASSLSEVRKGETTVAQVVKQFGRPSILSKNMDGTQTAAYLYVEGRSDAPAFVSLMTALAGNSNANVDSVILYFDGKGVLSGYKTTQAKVKEPEPAAAVEKTAQDASQPGASQAAVTKPKAVVKKESPVGSNPWTIQLYPSGYRENR